jgi:L-aspartate oxidase
LASNSLLEAIVFGARIADDINQMVPQSSSPRPAPPQTAIAESTKILAPMTARLRHLMTRHVGVLRSRDGLVSTLHELRQLEHAAQGLAPFANMILAAQFITMSALQRQESRGGHYRLDFPETSAQAQHTLMDMTDLRAAYDALPDATKTAPPLANTATHS